MGIRKDSCVSPSSAQAGDAVSCGLICRFLLAKVLQHTQRDLRTASGSGRFDLLIFHICGLPGLVRDQPQDNIGDTVQPAGVGDGCAFHLTAVSAGYCLGGIFLSGGGDELISAGDTALIDMAFRCRFAGGCDCHLPKEGICREGQKTQTRDLAGMISKDCGVHIMIDGIDGYQNIQHIHPAVQRAGDAGVDDVGRAETGDQKLRTNGSIDLADAGLNDNDAGIADRSFEKIHLCQGHDPADLHMLFQECDLLAHGTDNSDLHLFCCRARLPAGTASSFFTLIFGQGALARRHADTDLYRLDHPDDYTIKVFLKTELYFSCFFAPVSSIIMGEGDDLTMNIGITILLASALFLAAVTTLAAKPRFQSTIIGTAILVSTIGGLILYGYGYIVVTGNIFVSVVRAAFSTMGMYLGKNDLGAVSAAPLFNDNWVLFAFWFFHFAAFYSFASAAITTVGDEALKHLRLILLKRGNLHVIYGVNKDSVDFGSQLVKEADETVVYVDNHPDADCAKRVSDSGCLIFTGTGAADPDAGFLKSIGANPGSRRISLYCLSDDFNQNHQYADKFLNTCRENDIRAEQLSLTLLGYDEFSGSMFQQDGDTYGYSNVLVYNEPALAARLLIRAYPPVKTIPFDENGRATEDFDALILGFGRFGQEVLKYIVQNGQFVGSHFHLGIFDAKCNSISGGIREECAAMFEKYDIDFYENDCRSVELYRYLKKHRRTLRYVVICAGSSAANNELTEELQRFFATNKIILPIYQIDHSGVRAVSADGRQNNLDKIFSPAIITSNALDRKAIILNHGYCGDNGLTPEENWKNCSYFDRMSSRASADFAEAILHCAGVTKEEAISGSWQPSDGMLSVLGQTEHLRWCAFHYTMGFAPMDDETFQERAAIYHKQKKAGVEHLIRITKDMPGRIHACLIDWDALDELSAAEEAVTGKHVDYKQSDYNNILAIPDMLRAAQEYENKQRKG